MCVSIFEHWRHSFVRKRLRLSYSTDQSFLIISSSVLGLRVDLEGEIVSVNVDRDRDGDRDRDCPPR